jgi:metal-sulfur cluster biosynthetic enzyme
VSGHPDATPPPSGPLEIGSSRVHVAPASPVSAAWEALRCVYDPELCLDVVSLGLVYDVHEEHGNVVVEMTLTTPGCPVSESLPVEARDAVREVVAPEFGVEVEIVWDPPWNPDMMNDEAASALGFRRIAPL